MVKEKLWRALYWPWANDYCMWWKSCGQWWPGTSSPRPCAGKKPRWLLSSRPAQRNGITILVPEKDEKDGRQHCHWRLRGQQPNLKLLHNYGARIRASLLIWISYVFRGPNTISEEVRSECRVKTHKYNWIVGRLSKTQLMIKDTALGHWRPDIRQESIEQAAPITPFFF